MEMLTIIGLSLALIATIGSYIYAFKGNAEITAFAVSKLAIAFMPETFPGNDTQEAQLWRRLFSISSISLRSYPDIQYSDVQVVNGRYAGEERLIRVYNGGSSDNLRDVAVFYFSGAWILGSVSDNDRLLRNMALHTGFVVVGVEYSLAPEYPFPRGFDDALFGLQWVKHNIAQYGGNPERIFVTGESAGGNLAAAVAAHNLDIEFTSVEDRVNVVGVALVYPPLAANFHTESYTKYARYSGILSGAQMQHGWSLYAGGRHIPESDYTFQPLYAPDRLLSQFPPTEILVAEFDVLRDDSLMFADKLQALGVPVHVQMYNDTIHGFFGRDFSPSGDSSVKYLSDRLLAMSTSTAAVGNQQCSE